VSRNRLAQYIKNISIQLGIDSGRLFITSAKTLSGRKELLYLIAEYAGGAARNDGV
jgi:hypothetical protein